MLYREDVEDDLSELTSEAVPDEVRKWLASTFAKQEQVDKTGIGTSRNRWNKQEQVEQAGTGRTSRNRSNKQEQVNKQE